MKNKINCMLQIVTNVTFVKISILAWVSSLYGLFFDFNSYIFSFLCYNSCKVQLLVVISLGGFRCHLLQKKQKQMPSNPNSMMIFSAI